MADFLFNPYGYSNSQITMTTEDTANGFGKKKLANFNPRIVARTTSISSQIIEIDLKSSTRTDAVYIGNHNLVSSDTTVDLKGGDVSGVALATIDLKPLLTGSINTTIIIPKSPTTWNYRYIWLDITKAAGSYIQIGAFIPFQRYSAYDLDALPVADRKFNIDNRAAGGRLLNHEQKGYRNEIPFSGWVSKNVYVSIPAYQTPITKIQKEHKQLLKEIAESNYHIWVDWSGTYFGELSIDNVKDEKNVGDIDKNFASARMAFRVLDVIPKAVK